MRLWHEKLAAWLAIATIVVSSIGLNVKTGPKITNVRSTIASEPQEGTYKRSDPQSGMLTLGGRYVSAWVRSWGRFDRRDAPKQSPSPSKPKQEFPIYEKDSVPALIAKYWPGDDRAILCIVAKETVPKWNPYSKSRTGKYLGLFQADNSFRTAYGWKGWGIKEQVAMAWRGFKARGYDPWPTRAGCV